MCWFLTQWKRCCLLTVAEETVETRDSSAVADVHANMPPEPITADHIPVGLVRTIFSTYPWNEMRCYRNMLGISWRDKVSNDIIRQNMDRKETIIDIIRRRKLIRFGHICRMADDRLIKTVLLRSERKTYEEVDWQHHGVDWTVTVWSCLAVTRPCFMEQDCIWPQRFLTNGQEEDPWNMPSCSGFSCLQAAHWLDDRKCHASCLKSTAAASSSMKFTVEYRPNME